MTTKRYEIEIRRFKGIRFDVLNKEVFEDFTSARKRIAWYNEFERRKNTYAAGPWPLV